MRELRIRESFGAFRIVYIAALPEGVYVLHCFQKKTQKTSRKDIRSALLQGLGRWLAGSGMTQVAAAKALGVTQARISDIKRGKINQFSLDLLVRLAARAGLQPNLRLAA